MKCFVIVREESPGRFAAWPAGIPELRVTADSHPAAVSQVVERVAEWGRTGQLVAVDVEAYGRPDPRGGIDPNDPIQIEFMEELARFRREDRERTIREYEEELRRGSAEQKAG